MYLRFSSSLIATVALARASDGGEPGSGRGARRSRKDNEMVGILAVDAVPLKADRDPRALQAGAAPTCRVNGVETDFVDCTVPGIAGDGTACKEACEEACEGCSCCVGSEDSFGFYEEACDGFVGKVCPDGSCSGGGACRNADISYVVDACQGTYACFSAGYFGDLGRVVSSCNDETACKGAAYKGGSIQEISLSCNADFACQNAAYLGGFIQEISSSCNGSRACSFTAFDGGEIQEISSSCNGHRACEMAARDSGDIQEISSSCNADKACKNAARAGTIPNNMFHCCNSESACEGLAQNNQQGQDPDPDLCYTEAPTKSPTEALTMSPTEASTKAPISAARTPSSPTTSPTTGSTTAPWRPDWGGLNDRCVADGSASPWIPRYADKRTCCQRHYSWRLDGCMGAANTPTGKYFPDWAGSGTCKLDEGDAPSYMVNNPTSWLKDTLAQCCQAHFDWIYQECAGGASAVAGMWYPDWAGGTNACLNDDQQPSYMTQNPEMFMNDSRESCCLAWFSWAPDTCPGTP